jgi:hypothetical protein
MEQGSTIDTSYLGPGRSPILLSTDQLAKVVTRIGAIHAQLYSNYAGRSAIIAERLRWRARLQCDFDLNSEPAIRQHLEFLRSQSRSLAKLRIALENEQIRLVEQLNFSGYTVSWEDGSSVLSQLPYKEEYQCEKR